MKVNKKELAVGNTAYVVTKKYDSDQMKQVYHIDPAEIKKIGRKYITAIVQYRDQEYCLKHDGVIYEFALKNKTSGANDVLCLSEEDANWNKKYASWALERKGWVYDHFFGEAEDPEDCIVVGNIFDNPQLKKKYGKDWEEEHK